jgi:hypothetical protein
VLDALRQPERVRFFDITPVRAASRALREQLTDADVPAAVAEIIRREGLYGTAPGVH